MNKIFNCRIHTRLLEWEDIFEISKAILEDKKILIEQSINNTVYMGIPSHIEWFEIKLQNKKDFKNFLSVYNSGYYLKITI